MDCQETRKVIPDYVEHTISEEVTNAVEEHLCVCPSCRDFLSQCIDKVASKDFSPAEPKIAPKPQSQPRIQPEVKPQPKPVNAAPVEAAKVVAPVSPAALAPKVSAPAAEGKFGPFEIGIILIGLGLLLFLAGLLFKK